ncbi:MAG: ABC transporter ATP-binding protein [Oceanospirillaceae bacterium]
MPEFTPQDLLLDVQDLSIDVHHKKQSQRLINNFSFQLHRRETLCIAGESGSGKSLSSLALMGLLPKSVHVSSGVAHYAGIDLFNLSKHNMQALRGNKIAMIFQEPMTALNPILTIEKQLCEVLSAHQYISRQAVLARVYQVMDAVYIPNVKERLKQYPHELSGGMRQRVMIAMALLCKPDILIADEPTTALDVTIQAQILSLLKELQQDFDTAVLMITHDMGVVAEIADNVVVLKKGSAVEHSSTVQLFESPKHAYTQKLLDAVPRLGNAPKLTPPDNSAQSPILEVKDLTVRFDIRGGLLQRVQKRVHAVESISFSVMPGQICGVVGESGCGKSSTGRALMNLVPYSGSIKIAGKDIQGLNSIQTKQSRTDAQMIFQDPYASLNPRKTVGELVAEPIIIHALDAGQAVDDRVAELFSKVGLSPDLMKRYPHEFSGGQRQRVCIARALSLSPKLIIADESVSALDVSVQKQVLELLQDLQREQGMSYVFISHDMAVVEQICSKVAVMNRGRIVEIGPRDAIFNNPQHPYTQQLLSAVPIADPRRRGHFENVKKGDIPNPLKTANYVPEQVEYRKLGVEHLVLSTDVY